MKKPLFSIIIPCLNEEHFLPKLLKNLNSQTFKDFEVIVVDGHSDDKTVQVTQEFKAKYPLHLQTTKVRNVSFQRNLGAKKAKGKILIFFDADTQIPNNYLKLIHQHLKNHDHHFITTHMNVDSPKLSAKFFGVFTNLTFNFGKLINNPFCYGAMQTVEKEAFFKVGGFDDETKFGEDSQLFKKLLKSGYKYNVLSQPRYIFSTRRLDSEGFVKLSIKYIKLNLNILIKGHHALSKTDYQMGGKHYHQPHP